MKKLLFATFAVAGSIMAANAQEAAKDSSAVSTTTTTTVTSSSSAVVQDNQVEIKLNELPAEVKRALEDEKYKGWIINAAYKDAKSDKYIAELKNGADTKKVKFNKEGKAEND